MHVCGVCDMCGHVCVVYGVHVCVVCGVHVCGVVCVCGICVVCVHLNLNSSLCHLSYPLLFPLVTTLIFPSLSKLF